MSVCYVVQKVALLLRSSLNVVTIMNPVLCVGQFEVSSGRQDPAALAQTLQQEFSLVNLQIRNVNVEVRNRRPAPSTHFSFS